MTDIQITFLQDTAKLVKTIESSFIELAGRLYRIREEKLFTGHFEDFNEYLDSISLDRSTASKLCTVFHAYVVEGKQEPTQLAEAGMSKLYEAVPLIEKDGVDAAVIKAKTLSRSEIVEEKREEKWGVVEDVPKDDQRYAFTKQGKLIKTDSIDREVIVSLVNGSTSLDHLLTKLTK